MDMTALGALVDSRPETKSAVARGDAANLGSCAALDADASPMLTNLLKLGAKPNDSLQRHAGLAPLYWASSRGHVVAMEALLTGGAKTSWAEWNTPNWQALHAAAANGHGASVATLIKHNADLNATAAGDTPLIRATWNGHAACVKVLLEAGADATVRSPLHGSAVEIALARGDAACASLLGPPPQPPPASTAWWRPAFTLAYFLHLLKTVLSVPITALLLPAFMMLFGIGLGVVELDPHARDGFQGLYDDTQMFASEKHDLNLFQYGIAMQGFFIVLGAGHILGVLCLWGAFGRGVEVIANALWFIPVFAVRTSALHAHDAPDLSACRATCLTVAVCTC